MAVREILKYPDPFLRKPTRPVHFPDIELVLPQLVDMEDTLEECDRSGAALAAPQIGLPFRMFVTNQVLTMETGMEKGLPGKSGHQDFDPVVMAIPPYVINPTILKRSSETEMLDEGCLSFPGFGMKTRRHSWVRVTYVALLRIGGKWEKQQIEETYRGFWSQVFQHEIDHLDGKLFIDALPVKRRLEVVEIVRRAAKDG